jgi:membrane associated rhomboid family serine protease
MSTSELSVICKNCGSEVSPYVTECPYCGVRLRKRAPKLERRGDEIAPRERRQRRERRKLSPEGALRPYATTAAVLGPAILLVVHRALDKPLTDFGAIVGPVGSEWWRYLAAPFVYTNLGYLFVVGLAVAIFAGALERRLGSVPVAILLVACGALGMVAAAAIDSAFGGRGHLLVAAGGNGIALGALAGWFTVASAESRRHPGVDFDGIGVAVAAAVLLALPLVDDWANFWAGLGGGAVGALAGTLTAMVARTA